MSAAIAVRDQLDLRGSLIIAALLLAVIACERIYERTLFARERRQTRDAIRDHAHGTPNDHDREPARVVEPDHEPCTNCHQTICFCPRSGECEGCINLGCLHLTTPDLLCADCRTACVDCRLEDQVEHAVNCARDDAAVRMFR